MICFVSSSLLVRNKIIECPISEGSVNSPNAFFFNLILYQDWYTISKKCWIVYHLYQKQFMSYLHVLCLSLYKYYSSLQNFSLFYSWIMLLLKMLKEISGRCFDFTIFIMCLVFPHFSGFLCTFSLTGSTEYVER